MTDLAADNDLLTAKVTDFSEAARFGARAILALLGFLTLCGLLVPISGATIVPGVLVADGRTLTLRHPDGGVVAALPVVEGQRVKQGEVIMLLSGESEQAARDQLLARMASNDVTLARLAAELAGAAFPADLAQRFPSYPPDLLSGAIADQQSLFETRSAFQDAQIAVLGTQSDALTSQRAGVEGEAAALREQMASLEQDLEARRLAQAKGYGRATELRQVERESSALTGALARNQGELRALSEQIAEVEGRRVAFLNEQRQSISDEIARIRAEQNELGDRLGAAERAVDRVEVRAPTDGIVNKLEVNTVGSAVQPYADIAEIVPIDAQVVVEGRLSPNDIDNVRLGTIADVAFHSMSRHNEPPLWGRVEFISPDSQVDERTGARYFVIRMTIDSSCFQGPNPPVVSPGMIGDISVRTGSYTFFQYLLDPITRSFGAAFK